MSTRPHRPEEQPDRAPAPNAARRGLLRSMGALALLTSACGGGDDSDDTPAPAPPPPAAAPPPVGAPPPSPLACGATAVSANHGHSLTIPAADLDATANRTYSIAGNADHAHTIVLTPAQLAQIKAMAAVTVGSSVDFAHAHDVTVNCA